MARKKGSGYKTQLYILLVLNQFDSLYGQEIVEKTGLNREEIWRNLGVLTEIAMIRSRKVGRRTYYELAVSQQAFEIIAWVLSEGGPKQCREKEARNMRKIKRLYRDLSAVAKKANQYEDELLELVASSGEEPYARMLKFAIEHRKNQSDFENIGIKSDIKLPNFRKEQIRDSSKTPIRFETKEITLPSNGYKIKIREPTLFEIADAFKRAKSSKKEDDNSDIIEAALKLKLLESYG